MADRVESQRAFYESRYEEFGDDPRSLAINSTETQHRRYQTLSKLFQYEPVGDFFTVHEVGCGLGHFAEWLEKCYPAVGFSGSDICPPFVEACKEKFPKASFVVQDVSADLKDMPTEMKMYDYYLENGTFNPMEDTRTAEWEAFIFNALHNMFALCRKGIAVNFLSTYSHPEMRSPGLYYADPLVMYDWCKRNLSRFVSLLDDDPFYEFTLLVYRKDYIQGLHPDEYARYFKR